MLKTTLIISICTFFYGVIGGWISKKIHKPIFLLRGVDDLIRFCIAALWPFYIPYKLGEKIQQRFSK